MSQAASSHNTRRGLLRGGLAALPLLGATVSAALGRTSAEERLRQHLAGAEAALRELFPGVSVSVRGNCLDGHHRYYAALFAEGDLSANANVLLTANLPRS